MNKEPWQLRFAVFAVGTGLVGFWSWLVPEAIGILHDAADYLRKATEVAEGSGIASISFGDPGYVQALAIVFDIFWPSIRVAQAFNAILWGCATVLAYHCLETRLPRKKAFLGGLLFAASPMITTFAISLYSETFAVFSAMIFTWGFLQQPFYRRAASIAVFTGAFLVMVTKSAFFLTFGLGLALLLVRKKWHLAACLAPALMLAFPIQAKVQEGGRGVMQVADQTSRLEIPYGVLARCALYNLSFNVGKAAFPEVEGACRKNGAPDGKGNDISSLPMWQLNPWWKTKAKMDAGYTYGDAIKDIFSNPIKYAFICLTTLPSAFWIDGFAPFVSSTFPSPLRAAAWIFKILFSTALWVGVFHAVRRALRERGQWKESGSVGALFFPIGYFVLFSLNMPVELRHFLPLLPFMYLLNVLGWLSPVGRVE
jgi:hypothetical protein